MVTRSFVQIHEISEEVRLRDQAVIDPLRHVTLEYIRLLARWLKLFDSVYQTRQEFCCILWCIFFRAFVADLIVEISLSPSTHQRPKDFD